MKETTSGMSFYPLLSVLRWRTSLEVAVDKNVANGDVISATTIYATTMNNNETERAKGPLC